MPKQLTNSDYLDSAKCPYCGHENEIEKWNDTTIEDDKEYYEDTFSCRKCGDEFWIRAERLAPKPWTITSEGLEKY